MGVAVRVRRPFPLFSRPYSSRAALNRRSEDVMRDRRRVPSGPWQALAALSAALLVGCQSGLLSFASFNSSESGSERAVAEELPLGSWTRDRLHCAKDRCERWYEIAVEERGTLPVDLYAT